MEEAIVGELNISKEESQFFNDNIKHLKNAEDLFLNNLDKDVTNLIKILIASIIILKGSDIHIEPEEELVEIRLRIDGMLVNLAKINLQNYKKLLSRIKLLSRLKLNIEKEAQDGRFSINFDASEIEIRTSSLPSEYGESIVMRVLNPKNLISLEELGLRSDLEKLFNEEIQKPNGMIIVTGPTGSGKTTTLYAFLKKISRPENKVITIEDPIEYHLEGITQTQVDEKKGYDFANGLRSIVRQDPDAILVGEIRDKETAETAIQAALTGHLVLSTLHTIGATQSIARLEALGEIATNIAPAINIVIAQRLVRKVCPHCMKLRDITEEELKMFERELSNNFTIKGIKQIAEVEGCEFCNNTGYKGRVGIFEALVLDDELKDIILSSSSPTQLKEKALEKGMTTIRQDGLIKVLNKETTLEEIKRVAG
ncbi:MAG: GspE/PulE family protein [Candidatus Pacebacteria bacterium]|nr:GspE/PulE family protein [Candidatus Paceibacterota bacterium]